MFQSTTRIFHDMQRVLARKYAHGYFIYKQIPISVVYNPDAKWWSFQWDKKDLLLKGQDPAIDFVCEKIVDGNEFIMTEEILQLANNNMEGRS